MASGINGDNSIWAIITARGGSKGLPGKNIRQFVKQPLIAHTIQAALQCDLIGRCIVTTDDKEIGEVSRRFGAEVVERPAVLATDTASSADAVRHALGVLAESGPLPQHIVLLQPTSPLRGERLLRQCLEEFTAGKFGSAISVTREEHHPYKSFRLEGGTLHPLFGKENLEAPRQTLPAVVRPNGAIYVVSTQLFISQNTFFIEPVMPFMMSAEDSIDIDTELDLKIAEMIALERQR